MLITTSLYRTLLSAAGTRKEYKLIIAGTEFTGKFVAMSAQADVFADGKPALGCCVAQELDAQLLDAPETIPRAAELKLSVRLHGADGRVSEWIPRGTYYIDERELNDDGVLSLVAFDAMLKTEQPYLTTGDVGTWPKTDAAVVSEICTRLGVALDPRTSINKGYTVEMPSVSTDGSDSDSMRTVLGRIGAMYGGNWIITDEGKLRLLVFGDTSANDGALADEIAQIITFGGTSIFASNAPQLGRNVSDSDTAPAFPAISRVVLWVSDDECYTAGTDAGYTIEAECEWATQTIANDVLATLSGVVYRPFSAADALIDPATELGDALTVNGVASILYSRATKFDALCASDIAAPADKEIDHEYPYESAAARKIERKIAQTRASIMIDVDKIALKVSDVADGTTVGSLIEQTIDAITLSVSSGATGTKISLTNNGVTINSQLVDLKVKAVNISGTLTASQISAGAITADKIASGVVPTSTSQLYNNSGFVDQSGVTTIIGNTVTADYINAYQLTARSMRGQVIDIYGSAGYWPYGSIYAGQNSAGTTALELYGAAGLRLTANGNVFLSASSGGFITLSNGITLGGNVIPSSDGAYSLGSSAFRWSAVYASTGTIVTSDRARKRDIVYGLGDYADLFEALQPVSYHLTDGASGRRHIGFVAQDVEAALAALGMDGADFAGLCKTPREGGYDYGLRYEEFVALNTYAIQRLAEKIRRLEGQINGYQQA